MLRISCSPVYWCLLARSVCKTSFLKKKKKKRKKRQALSAAVKWLLSYALEVKIGRDMSSNSFSNAKHISLF